MAAFSAGGLFVVALVVGAVLVAALVAIIALRDRRGRTGPGTRSSPRPDGAEGVFTTNIQRNDSSV